ncbi:tetratricopeptide repeat protein [Microbulbifer rhizosphaerae]|uniref:Tetratricopeptide (TPR) repeat protein n=1 Tax=Microbulbifer rhizosphaerae TaxID=1562603 RepID=A0A7W4WEP6_9GAMM|nr:tetratricopeptide repeat protein [Microbulbifer rhizosphaerae]MBB3062884.1 tetratricopeptide (TPR) repeat protein [Microbulbifer rhizosphaerae]
MLRKLLPLLFLLLPLCAFSAADSVSSKTYKELTEIQEIMGQGKTGEAFSRLNTLLPEVEEDSLDKALILQTLGYVEMARENFPQAIRHLKACLALNRLPQKVTYNVGYMVAQLYAAQGEYRQALEFAEDWFRGLEAPQPSQTIFMANIYAQTGQYEKSVPYAEKAIAASGNFQENKPQESWYQLLAANYFELKRYRKAASTLARMLEFWPDNAGYWEQLAGVYVTLDDEKMALATLKSAFAGNYLAKESTIKSLIQLSVAQGIPEHGARLLERSFEQELLPQNEDYLKMLAQAYAAARERDKAIDAYRRLAQAAGGGEAWVAISNIHVEKGEWPQAEQALRSALEKKLESPGKARLLLGIAQIEQGKFAEGRDSLQKARAEPKVAASANRWLKYAEDMQRQAEWLAQNR